jgi:hypothetical protein
MGCSWHAARRAGAQTAIVGSAIGIRADRQPNQQRAAVGDSAARPCRLRVDRMHRQGRRRTSPLRVPRIRP